MKLIWRLIILCCYVGLLFLLFSPVHEDVGISFYSCQEINCSHALVGLLEEMPDHVCAFYDLEDEVIYNEINEGVLFEDNYEEKYSKLQSVSSRGLMHHKFCIFEEQYVLTGSWNPTQRGTYVNDNYILFIDSHQVAAHYKEAYDHLLERKKSVSNLEVQYDGGKLSLYICPLHSCQEQILTTLNQATQSVKILAFTFTDEAIAEELLALSRRGVDIEIIYEKTRITKYSTYEFLKEAGIAVYLDGNSNTMHEKMILIDNRTSILGSYNPTKGATTSNDENILIIEDERLFAKAYEEYMRIRSVASP